jgi:ParB/RepB/Spo0J family partition protein
MIKTLELNRLDRGTNIREENDREIMELADSIRQNGLINPLTVVKTGNRYKVVAGHRRFKALQFLNEPWVECNVLDYEPSETELLTIQLQENVCRKNMSAWELVDLFDKMQRKGMTREQIAKICGKTVSWISLQYSAEKCLERHGDINEATKRLTFSQIKRKYGHTGKTVCAKKPLKTVSYYLDVNTYYVRIRNKDAKAEFEKYMKEFVEKWQNSKISE